MKNFALAFSLLTFALNLINKTSEDVYFLSITACQVTGVSLYFARFLYDLSQSVEMNETGSKMKAVTGSYYGLL